MTREKPTYVPGLLQHLVRLDLTDPITQPDYFIGLFTYKCMKRSSVRYFFVVPP